MRFHKKLLFLSLTFLSFAAPSVFGASSFMNGIVLQPWKFSLNVCATPIMVNDDFLTMADIGLRVGLPGNLDVGLKAFKWGLIADIKYVFMTFYPFSLSVDFEGTIASQPAIGGALLMDLELNSFVAVYLSARWRYQSLIEVDTTYFTSGDFTPLGMMFLCRFGLELFRRNALSFGLEGGLVTSWTSTALGFNGGGMLIWHIN